MVSLTAHLVKQALAEPCYELGFDHQPPLDDALLAADVPFKNGRDCFLLGQHRKFRDT